MTEFVELGEVLRAIQAGKSFQTAEVLARPEELGVLKVSAVTWSDFRPTEAKALVGPYEPEESHTVKAGDFLISRANTKELVGAVVLVERDHPLRLLSDKTLRLVMDETRVLKEYLLFALRSPTAREHIEHFATGTSDSMRNISQGVIESIPIPLPDLNSQRRIAFELKAELAEIEVARQAAEMQFAEIASLANSIIVTSIQRSTAQHRAERLLGEVLTEVKRGIGSSWQEYPVLGATREGLAAAKEPVGKHPKRYKPVFAGTVFYNPMRILIGSIGYVDVDDTPGITSPDYVVLQGLPDIVDSRWLYYWLRSPFGKQCITSLARGAVRERMLFNRLADGRIALPSYEDQLRASAALQELKPMRDLVRKQIGEIRRLPARIVLQAFVN